MNLRVQDIVQSSIGGLELRYVDDETREKVFDEYRRHLGSVSGEERHEAIAFAAVHPNSSFRLIALESMSGDELGAQAEFVAWCLAEVDERVRGKAVELCQVNGLREPAILRAALDTVGRDPESLELATTTLPTEVLRQVARLALEQMGEAWAGEVVNSLPIPLSDDALGETHRSGLSRMVPLTEGGPRGGSEFLIDADLVTIVEYWRFVTATKIDGHVRCHYGEPADKDHGPAVELPGARDRTPAVGVDWFDAYGYAAWVGKRLPTDAEWESARRSVPRANSAPSRATASGDLPPQVPKRLRGEAALRLEGVTEHVWQWTSSRYLDRRPLDPLPGTLHWGEATGDWANEASIRGGSWRSRSVPSSSARAPLNVLVRSREVGFRCAVTAADDPGKG